MARPMLLLVAVMAFGCSSKQVLVAPPFDLSSMGRSLALTIEADEGVEPSVLEDLDRYLRAAMIIGRFELAADPPPNDAIALDVHVTEFDPGSQKLRMTVGFGAGRGSLLYTARYADAGGTVLAEMNGQERFTGTELDVDQKYALFVGLGGAETVQEVLTQEAAIHIIELGTAELD